MGVDDGIWLRDLESELNHHLRDQPVIKNPLVIYNDNAAAVKNILGSTAYTPPSRRVGVLYHWLRDMHVSQAIKVEQVSTQDMKADGLTKGLERVKHDEMLVVFGLEPIQNVK